jgi:hypothetical protein
MLICAHIAFTRGDHITENADIGFKMWRHCYLERLIFNQPQICRERYIGVRVYISVRRPAILTDFFLVLPSPYWQMPG